MGQFVNLTSQDGFVVPAWVAQPDGAPRGAVVVLQEIFGVNSHIRAVADRFAARGYLAVAPATFARVQPDVDLGYSEADMGVGFGLKTAVEALPGAGAMPDIQAAIDYAAQQGGGKVGIVGFCWGGLLAWRSACSLKGLSAAACYYGGGMTTADEVARQPQVPVLAHFGQHDHWISVDSVQAFARAHPDVQVHVYDADHGFNCDQRGSYDEASALVARDRTLAFFAKHVGVERRLRSGRGNAGCMWHRGLGPGAAAHQSPVTARRCAPGSVCARTAPPALWQSPSWSPAPTRIRLACG